MKTILVGVACLVVGLVAGIFVGRALLDREWSQPKVLERLSAADASRSNGKGGDPAPKEGSLVLRTAPFARARQVLKDLTEKDPVVLQVGAVGNTDEGVELHLVLKNQGRCAVTGFSGTAYGYDAYGHPQQMNLGGEHYVAFSEEKVEGLDAGKTHLHAAMLHNAGAASLALAQVDSVACGDGTRWTRQ